MGQISSEELRTVKNKLINLLLIALVFLSGGFYFTGINSFVSRCLETHASTHRIASLSGEYSNATNNVIKR